MLSLLGTMVDVHTSLIEVDREGVSNLAHTGF